MAQDQNQELFYKQKRFAFKHFFFKIQKIYLENSTKNKDMLNNLSQNI